MLYKQDWNYRNWERNCNEDLEQLKATYDAAISENTSMSDEVN
jgi:hypothetical protein